VRVTERAQHAVLQAKQEAARLGHDRVGTGHLLLGLLRDEQCLAVATLGGLGIAPEAVRRRVQETVGRGPGGPGMGLGLPMTRPATLVLSLAGRETMQLDHDRLGTEDLLLGLAREGEGVAARVLQELGAGLLELREAVAAQYAAGVDPEPFPPDRGPPPWQPPPSALARSSRPGSRETRAGISALGGGVDQGLAGAEQEPGQHQQGDACPAEQDRDGEAAHDDEAGGVDRPHHLAPLPTV
jgi:ATP-dependent Clp protease ATP-binding subunit ClpA